MRVAYDIEKLKSELIGKTINWITITDVFKDEHNHTVCSYICKCGTEKTAPIKVINSGKIKSCGCYKHSKEYSESVSEWCKNNPEAVASRTIKYKQWCKDNQDKVIDQGKRHSEFFSSHPELVSEYRDRMTSLNKTFNRDRSKKARIDSLNKVIQDNPDLVNIIHADDLTRLLSGSIRSTDHIRVRCPICNEFSPHNMRDIFNISDEHFKQARMCKKCFDEFSSSQCEREIADYISTFYSGELIRNDRAVLNGKELDLYYPEKKIAIEFNGDYWHSEEFKSVDYHYNKLKLCLDRGIILVSIFESAWINNSHAIKEYLHDLFNGIINSLSFANGMINNNYPCPNMKLSDLSFSESYYMFKDKRVYTCGFSNILS